MRENPIRTGARAAKRPVRKVKQEASRAAERASSTADMASDMANGARERAHDTYERATDWATGAYDEGVRKLSNARKTSQKSLRSFSDTVQDVIAERPYAVGLAGLAAGFLIGAMLTRSSSSHSEDEDWDEDDEDA